MINMIVTNMNHCHQVINDPAEFGLYIMQDTGIIQPCKEEDHPLMTRLKLGPNEVLLCCDILRMMNCKLTVSHPFEIIKAMWVDDY